MHHEINFKMLCAILPSTFGCPSAKVVEEFVYHGMLFTFLSLRTPMSRVNDTTKMKNVHNPKSVGL